MAWEQLPPLVLTPTGSFHPLELPASGGTLYLLIPRFAASLEGRYEVGVFAGTKDEPRLIGIQKLALSPFDRHIQFEIPPDLAGPLLGLRLLDQRKGSLLIQPRINLYSPFEDFMSFYVDLTSSLQSDVAAVDMVAQAALAAAIPIVTTLPSAASNAGKTFILSPKGETVTSVGGRWLGQPYLMFQGVQTKQVAATTFSTLDPAANPVSIVATVDFSAGGNKFIESMAIKPFASPAGAMKYRINPKIANTTLIKSGTTATTDLLTTIPFNVASTDHNAPFDIGIVSTLIFPVSVVAQVRNIY